MSALILCIVFAGCSEDPEPSASEATPAPAPDPVSLFDGKSLDGWRIVDDWAGGGGEVTVKDGAIHIGEGTIMNGIVRDGFVPPGKAYEIRLEAMRVEGRDIFLGITFPVPGKDSCISFVAGGWGGETTGLSNIDGQDAMENATGSAQRYENGRWYAFRIRASEERVDVWMDERHISGAHVFDKKISLRPGDADLTVPFGLFTYQTEGAVRRMVVEAVSPTR